MRALTLVVALLSMPAFAADPQATGGLSQPWAMVLSAVIGAAFAGGFAMWQAVRNAHLQKSLAATAAQSQRDLEAYKDALHRVQSDLERSKQSIYDFRVQRLTPFLEALNNSIVESYSAVIGLQMLARFKRHVPAMVTQRDKDMAAWMESMQAMSRLRIQALLSIDSDAVGPLIRSIEELVQLQRALIEVRSDYLSDAASDKELADAHGKYVRAGFALLLQARNALAAAAGVSTPKEGDDRQELLEDLPLRLERSSIVSLSYGRVPHNAWIASWTVGSSLLSYEKLTHAAFQQAVQDVATAIWKIDDVLDVKLVRKGSEEEMYWVLCVSFADKSSLEHFASTTLPAIKRQSKSLWTGLVAAVETTVD